ncbi:MAG: hypothetical protein NT062_19585 [Proteobacteria bacterium]|nr:hypothetical protein [Pseudomonadota bacterium]
MASKLTDEQRRMYSLEAAVSKEGDFPVRLDAHLARMRAKYPSMPFTRRHAVRSLLHKALKAEEAKSGRRPATKPKSAAKRATKR